MAKKATKLPERRKPGLKLGQRLVDNPRLLLLQIRVNPAEIAALDKLAKSLKLNRSAAIRQAIQKAVESD